MDVQFVEFFLMIGFEKNNCFSFMTYITDLRCFMSYIREVKKKSTSTVNTRILHHTYDRDQLSFKVYLHT